MSGIVWVYFEAMILEKDIETGMDPMKTISNDKLQPQVQKMHKMQ